LLGLCRFGLGVYLLLAPFGTTFREIGGILATVSVAAYYAIDWRGSVLRTHPLRWIFAVLLGLILFKTVHSTHPSLSWYVIRHGVHGTFFLGLAGLESIRAWKHARSLLWCAAVMAFAEGLVGVWQGVTGEAPAESMQYVTEGRLVGTMGTPRVGNLLSLVLPLALAAPLARAKPGRPWERLLVASALLAPALYLLLFSKTRSGWFGFGTALAVMAYMRFGWRALGAFLAGCAALALFFDPPNISWQSLTTDTRWEIWSAAVQVFLANPFLGAGINTFGDAYRDLGTTLSMGLIPHPHCVYLQALAETGVVGLAVFLLFLLGSLYCMVKPLWLRRHLRGDPRFLLALAPAAAWAGYLVTAISAHSFFRTWWLGFTLITQGLGLACARLLVEDRQA